MFQFKTGFCGQNNCFPRQGFWWLVKVNKIFGFVLKWDIFLAFRANFCYYLFRFLSFSIPQRCGGYYHKYKNFFERRIDGHHNVDLSLLVCFSHHFPSGGKPPTKQTFFPVKNQFVWFFACFPTKIAPKTTKTCYPGPLFSSYLRYRASWPFQTILAVIKIKFWLLFYPLFEWSPPGSPYNQNLNAPLKGYKWVWSWRMLPDQLPTPCQSECSFPNANVVVKHIKMVASNDGVLGIASKLRPSPLTWFFFQVHPGVQKSVVRGGNKVWNF